MSPQSLGARAGQTPQGVGSSTVLSDCAREGPGDPTVAGRSIGGALGRAVLVLLGVAAAWILTALLHGSAASAQTLPPPVPAAVESPLPPVLAALPAPAVAPLVTTSSSPATLESAISTFADTVLGDRPPAVG